jgi:hypothetical protein
MWNEKIIGKITNQKQKLGFPNTSMWMMFYLSNKSTRGLYEKDGREQRPGQD